MNGKIDSHQHFWKYDPPRYTWIDDSMQVLQQDYLPEDLAPVLKKNGFDACVAVQAVAEISENDFLLNCAAEHDFIKAVVGWADLCSPEVASVLEKYAVYEKFKGIRSLIQSEGAGFMLRKDFQDGLGKLAHFDLTFDLLLAVHQLPEAVILTQKFPDQPFVIDHLAKPQFSAPFDEKWSKNMKKLGALDNVFCKVSGMVTETKDFKWQNAPFQRYLDTLVEAFGTKKLLFGSDWPVCNLAADYGSVVDIVQNYFKGFSDTEQNRIFGGNATEFYGIYNK